MGIIRSSSDDDRQKGKAWGSTFGRQSGLVEAESGNVESMHLIKLKGGAHAVGWENKKAGSCRLGCGLIQQAGSSIGPTDRAGITTRLNGLHLLGPKPDPVRRLKAQKAKCGLKKRAEDQQAGSHNDTTDKDASLYGLIGPVLLRPKQSGSFESSKAQKHGQRSFRGLKKGSKEASLDPKVVLTCSKEETWAEDEDARPDVKGFSRSDPLVDPAWICARGPLLDAYENRTGLVDFVSFESCWEEGLWEVSSDCPLMGSSSQGPREE